jgi:predicted metal-dependent hydrolase
MESGDPRRYQILIRVNHWKRVLNVSPRIVRVQSMTKKWGSCSSSGVITLALELLECDPAFLDYVIAHELLHLRLPRHGRLFNAVMTAHCPGWRDLNLNKGRYGTPKVTMQKGRTPKAA